MKTERIDVLDPSGAEVIQHFDFITVFQERPDQIGSDKSGAACHEYPHI
jgi:hypothetical protein